LRLSYLHLLSASSLAALGTGCASNDPVTSSPPLGSIDSGIGGAGDCSEADTQPCSCSNYQSIRTCIDGAWSDCDCRAVVYPDAGDTNPDDSPCKAGYYTGTFEGEYWSGIFDPGGGVGSLVPLPIKATGANGIPGLALTLEETVEGENSEFPVYTVGDGCVVGVAEALGGLFGNHPFVGTIQGELDCYTGKFEGTLVGYYTIFGIPEIKYNFSGPVTNQYSPGDPPKLGMGAWNVREHDAPNAPGGGGTWDVSWTSDDGPALPPECQALIDGMADGSGDAGI
jgi:hypothetical protein